MLYNKHICRILNIYVIYLTLMLYTIQICSDEVYMDNMAMDSSMEVPYSYSASVWVGYDDITSVQGKVCSNL